MAEDFEKKCVTVREIVAALTATEAAKQRISIVLRRLSDADGAECSVSLHEIQAAFAAAATGEALSDRNQLEREMDAARRRVCAKKDGEVLWKDLTADEMRTLLPIAFRLGTAVANEHQSKSQRLSANLKELCVGAAGMDASLILGRELTSLAAQKDLRVVVLDHQLFDDGTAGLLVRTLSSNPMIEFVDLCYSVISDAWLQKCVPVCAALQHLRILLLRSVGASQETGEMILDFLQRVDGGAFSSLRILDVSGNAISAQVVGSIVKGAVNRRAARIAIEDPVWALSAKQKLRVLTLDGGMMRNYVTLRLLCEVERETCKPCWELFDVVAATSFGCIIACAIACHVPMSEVDLFFLSIAHSVFSKSHYTYYAEAAGRAIRSWFTSGNYYNAAAFRSQLVSLFGSESRPYDFTQPKLFLSVLRKNGTGDKQELLVLRSFRDSTSCANGEVESDCAVGCNMIDVLMGACAAETYFAPYAVKGMESHGALADAWHAQTHHGLLRVVLNCVRHVPAQTIGILSLGASTPQWLFGGVQEKDAAGLEVDSSANNFLLWQALATTQVPSSHATPNSKWLSYIHSESNSSILKRLSEVPPHAMAVRCLRLRPRTSNADAKDVLVEPDEDGLFLLSVVVPEHVHSFYTGHSNRGFVLWFAV